MNAILNTMINSPLATELSVNGKKTTVKGMFSQALTQENGKLSTNQQTQENIKASALTSSSNEENLEALLSKIKELINGLDEVEGLEELKILEPSMLEEIQKSLEGEGFNGSELEKLLMQMDSSKQNELPENFLLGKNGVEVFHFIQMYAQQLNENPSNIEKNNATKSLEEIFTGIQKLLDGSSNKAENRTELKNLLAALEKWSNQTGSESTLLKQGVLDTKTERERQIWERLVNSYQNKVAIERKIPNAPKLTLDDLANMLKKAMQNYDQSASSVNTTQKTDTDLLVNQNFASKIQQFVVHVQSSNQEEVTTQQKLLDQFQQILSKSNFMKGPNGATQLMLKLQPEHLGEITLKLTQINGEMVVKMIASSQGAKELLEGNLSQLRHMFSPQQVVVEKADLPNSQLDQKSQQGQQASAEDREENHSSYEEQELDSENESEDENSFHQILMNEKV
ncbi:flagellar hook-length control protein FliK [Saliterribacillus persicus]|uniref:Flagellar hook-length control protein FliK n=1 Tax=Saliterribacillus persicus TaxID=930114 RepID=A0A368XXH3_9BACI|nr:flagellar hook-length control protein FliK [Saliterribacillus persicus]RCW70714.1 flagellar hook-length control protein FliK [Saliterribacillus persicus]